MIGVARQAPPFTRGVDALQPFTRAELLSLKQRYAITVVGAYVEVLAEEPAYRDLLFELELGIAPYSEASIGAVDRAIGHERGTVAANLLAGLGCPAGVDLLIDMEDVTGPGIPDYVNARASAYALPHRFGSLLYVGEPLPAGITPELLQRMLPPRYMRSCSLGVPDPIRRHWCVLQHNPGDYLDPVLNKQLDHFTVEEDALGGLPTWWWPS